MCGCICSVSFPRGAMGWYVVCGLGVSSSYSLVLLLRYLARATLTSDYLDTNSDEPSFAGFSSLPFFRKKIQ